MIKAFHGCKYTFRYKFSLSNRFINFDVSCRVQILQKTVVSDVAYPRAALDTMTIDQLTVTLWWTTFAAAAEEDDAKHQALVQFCIYNYDTNVPYFSSSITQ